MCRARESKQSGRRGKAFSRGRTFAALFQWETTWERPSKESLFPAPAPRQLVDSSWRSQRRVPRMYPQDFFTNAQRPRRWICAFLRKTK